ncbi:UTP--glucose-1-phosphate uridylyltransferase [Arcanobacterium wilhelmae]|uniref:UTP--glucose-1-phosphate uridylyltransferase n=1 Tax=Arcanobacterium wilhelmae TaxID=1803177 RepID=A0ABT9NAW0_9ACTO|nr:UTP--glucose-1-phosphate uridylyltransferase [Arcanobacterium wilhelmae]MDP9800859.1 UTP--glucose-1-phosphate uridylyltransferase [Arcanobacterium wilhelmae]WFN90228.1 UTP--glucose-1-phosphate uridylyltransferase [Arcanobacterium wilhelmae]
MGTHTLSKQQQAALDANLEKMRADGARETAMRVFEQYFVQVANGATGLIAEDEIEPLRDVEHVSDLDLDPEVSREALGRTVFLRLNGGLGTSMGLDRAKSLLTVREGKSFLEITTEQLLRARERTGAVIPLMFLNSFRTREDTLAAMDSRLATDLPVDVVQNREPKILEESLEPISWEADPELEWCPPGHGDLFTTFYESGIVDRLLDAGYRYLNCANSDNLGAYPSGAIAGWFAQSGADFAPEVCRRTLADVKGGHFAVRRSDGRIILRDRAQTPIEDLEAFADLDRHMYFNTNTMWFDLEALRDLLRATEGVVGLPLIRNKKTVDPTLADSPRVIQIESAMGAIVEKFADSRPIVVDRDRFLPVKTTNDLALLRSDAYEFDADYRLVLTTDEAPVVRLDPQFYAYIADFERHFSRFPSIRECERFVVAGEWFFDADVAFSGVVELGGRGTLRS